MELLSIFKAGLAAADPVAAVRRCVSLEGGTLRLGERRLPLAGIRDIWVLGAGKASARMAAALEEILGERIAGGWVNVKAGGGEALRRVRVHEAGHPLPDEAGVAGAREMARLARQAGPDDLVLFCVSGGGSALMPLPVDGLTLADQQAVTQALLGCGAPIREINAVRKHLSQLAGGQLARLAQPARVAALILSDVIGDPLDVIASGPTAPDPGTFAEALGVLEKYGLTERVPPSVMQHLRAGAAGRVAETPKPGEAFFERVTNLLVANNSAAVEACARRAKELGLSPLVPSTTLDGEASEAAGALAAMARRISRRTRRLAHDNELPGAGQFIGEVHATGRPVAPPACLICGGETTVTLRGKGKGGRNQEFALAAALALQGMDGIHVLAAGTDGTDGPTDAAGAFADGATCARAAAVGLDATRSLVDNDSYAFFDRLGDLLRTGPTGTNVMDLYLITVRPSGDGGMNGTERP